jgi:hypothetical protein
MIRPEPEDQLIAQYRNLVGALLEHTWLDHEGTEAAIADFIESGDRALGVLQEIQQCQAVDRSEVLR